MYQKEGSLIEQSEAEIGAIEPMADEELESLVGTELTDATSFVDAELSPVRARAIQYYRGEPFGNEEEGRSQVVSTDVRDTIAGIPKNIKPGTPPQLGLQVIQQYLQQPDVQQRFQQDQPFRERLEARAKQYQFQLEP